jgi:hypothetical protein
MSEPIEGAQVNPNLIQPNPFPAAQTDSGIESPTGQPLNVTTVDESGTLTGVVAVPAATTLGGNQDALQVPGQAPIGGAVPTTTVPVPGAPDTANASATTPTTRQTNINSLDALLGGAPEAETEPGYFSQELNLAAAVMPLVSGPIAEIQSWLQMIPESQATQGITAACKKMHQAVEDLPTLQQRIESDPVPPAALDTQLP